jgi:hypothetical protein
MGTLKSYYLRKWLAFRDRAMLSQRDSTIGGLTCRLRTVGERERNTHAERQCRQASSTAPVKQVSRPKREREGQTRSESVETAQVKVMSREGVRASDW